MPFYGEGTYLPEEIMKTKRYIICNEKTNYMDKLMKDKLPRRIHVSDDAVPDHELGWICDCGRWTEISRFTHEMIGND